jgi:predicted nucleotidyltransferase
MRLTADQINTIKHNTHQIFGANARVYLFGSRVDDHAKGGDIDLFIELPEQRDKPLALLLKLNGALQQALGMQKIDIIIHTLPQRWLPIHLEAKNTGILL